MMTITEQPIDALKPTAHNPAHRVSKPYLKDLLASIPEVGLLMPLLVDGDLNVGDGHRRLAACKLLGWKTIPTVVTSVALPKAYAHANANAKRLTGADHLSVYLNNPEAVSAKARRTMDAMTKTVGRRTVEYMVQNGGSVATYKQARHVSEYCGIGKDKVKDVVRWLLDEGMTYKVRKALEDGIDPVVLRTAILEKRGIGKVWQ